MHAAWVGPVHRCLHACAPVAHDPTACQQLHAQDKDIGRDFALYYEAYATYFELRGNYQSADAVYQEGVNRCLTQQGLVLAARALVMHAARRRGIQPGPRADCQQCTQLQSLAGCEAQACRLHAMCRSAKPLDRLKAKHAAFQQRMVSLPACVRSVPISAPRDACRPRALAWPTGCMKRVRCSLPSHAEDVGLAQSHTSCR